MAGRRSLVRKDLRWNAEGSTTARLSRGITDQLGKLLEENYPGKIVVKPALVSAGFEPKRYRRSGTTKQRDGDRIGKPTPSRIFVGNSSAFTMALIDVHHRDRSPRSPASSRLDHSRPSLPIRGTRSDDRSPIELRECNLSSPI